MNNNFILAIKGTIKVGIVGATLAVICGSLFGGCSKTEDLPMERTAVVYRCDNAKSEVYVETSDGNQWTFFGYGYEVGEKINVVIDDGCVINAYQKGGN